MSQDLPPPPGWQPPRPPTGPPAGSGWGQQQPAPPPGWNPAPYPRVDDRRDPYADYSYPGGATPPGYPPPPPATLPVAHKPGAVPLRPLVLSDLFDSAFKIIRYNPRATIGAAVLVSAVALVVPVVVGLASGSAGSLTSPTTTDTLTDTQVVRLFVAFGGLLGGTELQSIGLLFVSGMIAHVTSAAAVGRRLTMAEAWAATRGKRWRLLGLSLLLGLGVLLVTGLVVGAVVLLAVAAHPAIGLVVVLAILLGVLLVVGYLWFWVRVRALAVPALMLEPVGVFGAVRRAVRLTRDQFWRLLGLLLLVTLVVGVAGGILRAPFTIAGQVVLTGSNNTGAGLAVYLLLTGVGTIVSSALLEPFSATVSALLYVDQRIRKEAYDVELLGRAGILPS
ncbi:MAG TPA: hypothetical protein VHW64_05035 [Nocardioides sp.]|uniref:hypothetical protein n=1 Tax=Nocardioides sp. TaxID=35761 RepID=UPI002E320732|nr:hypothetical protein [Nocardioides sp.]HEX3930044.1 hypothetical protein [Nocardioides sp.]